MRRALIFLVISCSLVACKSSPSSTSDAPLESANGLAAPAEFDSIENTEERSKAIFGEMSKVLTHPRCVNCHPAGDQPLQTDEMLPHQPLVVRGEKGFGAPGQPCSTCHGEANFGNVPGNPVWHLAPASMAWEGKTVTEICEQIKDVDRNGGKDLAAIVEHMKEDSLVGYGWNPPPQYEAAPGSQALLGALTEAWVTSGAHCP